MSTAQIRQQQLVKVVAMLTLVVGVALFVVQLYLWTRFHVRIPVTDQVYLLPLMQSVVEDGFLSTNIYDWIAPASGAHRIAVTRLLMAIDYLYLNGQNRVIYLATWVSIATLLVVILKSFRSSFGSEKSLLLFVAGIALAFLSSRSQLWNVVNPINSSWYITFAASALSFACITSRPNPPTASQISAAYLLSGVAAFSTFSGVLVWLILPLLIALRSTRAGIFAALVSAVLLTLYLSGVSTDHEYPAGSPYASELAKYLPSEPIPMSRRITSLVTAVSSKTLVFLGSPLSITHPKLAASVVIASVLMVLGSWMALFRSWLSGQVVHNAWIQLNLAIATLCVGTATAANLGRLIMSTPAADRYQTIVMLYWLSICGLIVGFGLEKTAATPLGRLACMALCITVSTLFLANSAFPVTTSVRLSEAADKASALDAFGVPGKYLFLSAWQSGYLNDFHSFFKDNKLAHRASENQLVRVSSPLTDCPDIQFSSTPADWPGIRIAAASIDALWVNWNRKIPVSTDQGEIIGYLYPSDEANNAAKEPLLRRGGVWRGYLDSTIETNHRVYLHFRSYTLAQSSCGVLI